MTQQQPNQMAQEKVVAPTFMESFNNLSKGLRDALTAETTADTEVDLAGEARMAAQAAYDDAVAVHDSKMAAKGVVHGDATDVMRRLGQLLVDEAGRRAGG